jgi:signal transduction histidine kinase
VTGFGIRTRLALVFATGFAVLLALGALGVYLHLASGYRRDFDRSLIDAGRGARSLFRMDRPEYGTADATTAHIISELVYGDRTIVAYDSSGRFLAATQRFPDEPYFNDAPAAGPRNIPITVELHEGTARVLRAPIAEGAEVIIAMSTLPLEGRLARLKRSLATVLPVVLVLGALIGAWTSGLVLRPIVKVAESAERIGEGVAEGATRFDRLPSPTADDEVATLTGAFNLLVDRLSAALERERALAERQRRFLADAAHELRTPVTILRSEAEVTLRSDADLAGYRRALEHIVQEAQELGNLVADLLLLARDDAGAIAPVREPFYLDDIANRVLSRIRVLPAATGRDFRRGEFEAAPVTGDPHLVERALFALVHNALIHAPGAMIELSTGATNHGEPGESWIRVRDEGPGIPSHLHERAFERFGRLNGETPGSGLGLAIAKAIVQAHGGSLVLEETPVGASFLMRLPTT